MYIEEIQIYHEKSMGCLVEVPIPEVPPADEPWPSDMTDLELFRKFCMPLPRSDLWHEVPEQLGLNVFLVYPREKT